MRKPKTVEEFIEFRSQVLEGDDGPSHPCLVICAGTGGQASGSNDVMRIIKREMLERRLHGQLSLRVTGCQGFCELDPFILVQPGEHLYPKLTMDDVPRVIDAALAGEVLPDLLYREEKGAQPIACQEAIPFFSRQQRTILGMNELIDPIRIMDYLEQGGYAALERVLRHPDPAWIVAEVQKAGLRGRGGAGFPTGDKWAMARNQQSNGTGQKYLVCNADEGDPGAYMDRSLLEGNPHRIIEGMLIGGIGIGATHGIIYVRSEYPLAIKHATIALAQARDLGILGKNIFGTGLDFDIEIVRGAGAFVCGEETALIRSIEGHAGEPRQRPPFPVERGIRGCPTCINNVETLSNVPVILEHGAEEYAKVGTPNNTGTKIFSLVGKIRNTGLVEVPLGTTLGEVVYGIGGGAPPGRQVKAIQTGGPSGGCIPARLFDLPIDYDSLQEVGSIMGSGGMIVMDDQTCMVDVARYFMGFLKAESCGKCYTCRKGTQRMYELLEDITQGRGTPGHLDLLEELALAVRDTTLCGLGQTASNPVLSTLRYFRDEYVQHILNRRCPAGTCTELVGAPCQDTCPVGTEAWRYIAHLQRGEHEEAYRVIRASNPLPSVCARVCDHPCESRCRAGTSGGEAIAVRALKRFVTDRVDPAAAGITPPPMPAPDAARVAVVGSGPAGLTAAHKLAKKGYQVTLFEAERKLGGMLVAGIPAYRLPRPLLEREIEMLLGEAVTVRLAAALGRDVTVDGLLGEHQAVLLALGAHQSQRLGIPGEDLQGVLPAMGFLKAFNLEGEDLARGRVGIIGGGNSAIDSARVALRQPGVDSVTLVYRRSRSEMPAFPEEIEAALEEGVELTTLVSPLEVQGRGGQVTGVRCQTNRLGELDASGRRRPVPVFGSERTIPLDTLIVAIGERPSSEGATAEGVEVDRWGCVLSDAETAETGRVGVFATGDLVTGPSTVIGAIAAGQLAAAAMDRYLKGERVRQPAMASVPSALVEPLAEAEASAEASAAPPARPTVGTVSLDERRSSLTEVELAMSPEEALREAGRCLRCDLEFTRRPTGCRS